MNFVELTAKVTAKIRKSGRNARLENVADEIKSQKRE
jgi:hypothetical protein